MQLLPASRTIRMQLGACLPDVQFARYCCSSVRHHNKATSSSIFCEVPSQLISWKTINNMNPKHAILLQFDFPFAGPWGTELASTMTELASEINAEPGLLWKIWTENPTTGRAGGVYLFSNQEDADRYCSKHTTRLQAFGISGIVAHSFNVNIDLTTITRGALW